MTKRKSESGNSTYREIVVTYPAPKPIRDDPRMDWVYEMLGWKRGSKKSRG